MAVLQLSKRHRPGGDRSAAPVSLSRLGAPTVFVVLVAKIAVKKYQTTIA
jgi:hypothetical protein